jgi:hypothetical protein
VGIPSVFATVCPRLKTLEMVDTSEGEPDKEVALELCRDLIPRYGDVLMAWEVEGKPAFNNLVQTLKQEGLVQDLHTDKIPEDDGSGVDPADR